jgi:hypothetical protein
MRWSASRSASLAVPASAGIRAVPYEVTIENPTPFSVSAEAPRIATSSAGVLLDGRDHAELVTAHPVGAAAARHSVRQASSQELQHGVARRVAEGVVVPLEGEVRLRGLPGGEVRGLVGLVAAVLRHQPEDLPERSGRELERDLHLEAADRDDRGAGKRQHPRDDEHQL